MARDIETAVRAIPFDVGYHPEFPGEYAARRESRRRLLALALLPLVVWGSRPSHEIEHHMAIVILGGLASSTALIRFNVQLLFGPRDLPIRNLE